MCQDPRRNKGVRSVPGPLVNSHHHFFVMHEYIEATLSADMQKAVSHGVGGL